MTQAANSAFYDRVSATLAEIEEQGLTKPERVIASRQGPVISVNGRDVLNFCANNYLGLAGDERVTQAGIKAAQKWGAGTASVRFICGTLEIHKELERAIADYLGFEDTILFAAAFDANGGIFEPLFGEEDAIVSDSLNHASIIDGVRLCKAKRYRFANSDMADLETQLKAAREAGARDIIIATDGAFSMDGYIGKLDEIRKLADQYGALIMVDDCHATGFLGPKGKGSFAHHGVKVDFVTGTFGKALGGGHGRFYLRQCQCGRPAEAAGASLPVLERSGSGRVRLVAGSHPHRGGRRGRQAARPAVCQCPAFPHQDGRGGL